MKHIVFIRLSAFYIRASGGDIGNSENAPTAVSSEGCILDASPTAISRDVHAGITLRLARQRCPNLISIDHDPDRSAELFHQVWTRFAAIAPLVEPIAFHEGYLDLSGCIPRGRSLEQVIEDLYWRIRFDFGIDLQWGAGQDKWIARLACGENRNITPAEEHGFLKHIAIERLGFSHEICERCTRFGLRTVAEFLSVPQSFLQTHLQLSPALLKPYVQRGDFVVRNLYPPPRLTVGCDVDGQQEDCMSRTISHVSHLAEVKLRENHQQCRILRVTLGNRIEQKEQEIKLSKPTDSAALIERLLLDVVWAHKDSDLRSIRLELGALVPAPRKQGELWLSSMNMESRMDALENIQGNLGKRLGHRAVQTASQFGQRFQQRFAQLVYAKRGFHLP